MTRHELAIKKIIEEQKAIIGPLATDLAAKIETLTITKDEVRIMGDPKEVLDKLVLTYSNVFGDVSIEVCKSVIKDITPPLKKDDLPTVLRD